MPIPATSTSERPPRRARRSATRALLAAALLLPVAGCGTFRARELPAKSAHSIRQRQAVRGLTVAATVLTEPREVRRHYGPELWSAGYFPVLVRLENRGDTTFEVERDRFEIWLEGHGDDEVPLRPVPPNRVIEGTRRSTAASWLLLPLLVFPALWARESIDEYNFLRESDLVAKSLATYHRIEPGDPQVDGTLFFARPEGETEDLSELLASAELWLVAATEGDALAGADREPGADPPVASEGGRRVGASVRFIVPIGGGDR